MDFRFIITLSEHRYLGWILIPTLVKESGSPFITFHEQASTLHFNNTAYFYNEPEKELIQLFERFSEHQLMKLFGKTATLNDFYSWLTLEYFEERVRPYIEKWMVKMLQIIVRDNYPVYHRKANYNNLYEADKVQIVHDDAFAVFNFKDEIDKIDYHLSIKHHDNNISLLSKQLICLSNNPCRVVIGNKLFFFHDVDAKKLNPFTKKNHISIPGSARKKYMESFVLNAIKNSQVVGEGFTIEVDTPSKSAHLILEENLEGQPILNLKFKYGNRYFIRSGKASTDVSYRVENDRYVFQKFERDDVWEENLEHSLLELGLNKDTNSFFYPENYTNHKAFNLYLLVNWINDHNKVLEEKGFTINQHHYDADFYTGSIALSMDMKDAIDWFELYGVVNLEGFKIPFVKFKKHILSGTREYQLPNGKVVVLPLEWFSRYQEIFKFSKDKEDSIVLDKMHFNLLQTRDVRQVDKEAMLEVYSHIPDKSVPVPEGLKATLRSYQVEGYSWMLYLQKNKFGGCLADDMGLGKTLQALAVLQKVYEGSTGLRKRKSVNKIVDDSKPREQLTLFDQKLTEEELEDKEQIPASIIVMPKSLLHNWQNEIKKFCPGMLVYKYTGNKRLRTMDIWKIFRHFNVILTSYGVVRNDLEFLQTYKYHYLILDESHFIKNPSSKIYRAVNQLEAKHRMAITGTPIENSLQDLWAQFNFINPGLLGSQRYFKNHFVIPITKNKDEKRELKLQKIIQPFILRRTKDEVAKDLPELTEQVLYCAMTEAQKELYVKEKSGIRNNLLRSIEDSGLDKARMMALQGLMRLRLLANHPVLVDNSYLKDSGKYDRIKRNLKNLKAEGHKVLIFSSFVKHLKVIEKYLIKKDWKYSMLTGSTENREEVISNFMNDTENQVFLISLKAGGVGLNLTEADYVFILDPWWNPAAEMQAVNRAHRIGQNKPVMVYRFITTESIEEKIGILQEKKSQLANTFVNNNNPFKNITKEELDELFR